MQSNTSIELYRTDKSRKKVDGSFTNSVQLLSRIPAIVIAAQGHFLSHSLGVGESVDVCARGCTVRKPTLYTRRVQTGTSPLQQRKGYDDVTFDPRICRFPERHAVICGT